MPTVCMHETGSFSCSLKYTITITILNLQFTKIYKQQYYLIILKEKEGPILARDIIHLYAKYYVHLINNFWRIVEWKKGQNVKQIVEVPYNYSNIGGQVSLFFQAGYF